MSCFIDSVIASEIVLNSNSRHNGISWTGSLYGSSIFMVERIASCSVGNVGDTIDASRTTAEAFATNSID